MVSRMISGGSAGLMTMMALPFGRRQFLDRAGGGAGELVDVLARAGADRAARYRGHDFAVAHGLHARNRRHHGDGGLAAAGDHVHVHGLFCHLLGQVHAGHAVGADGGGRQVDHQHAQLVELAAVFGVDIGAGGVEGDLDAVFLDKGQQAVHTVGRGLDAHLAGTLQTIGFGVDTDHPHRLQQGERCSFMSRSVPILPGPISAHLIFFCVMVSYSVN
jgi:hypothetical protein